MKISLVCGEDRGQLQITQLLTIEDLENYASILCTFSGKIVKIPKNQLSIHFISNEGNKVSLQSDKKKTLVHFGVLPFSQIQVKNLGKQIKWEYVFYIEYAGPIIIIPAFFFLGARKLYTWVQPFAAIMGVTHYIKRQLETAFVHIFSRKSMPLKRVFINSAHYWILFALLNSIELFMFPKKTNWDANDIMILFFIWATMEFCNFKCHYQLSSFRKKAKVRGNGKAQSQKVRGIPETYGFRYVSCANYLWETLGWITFSLLTKCYSSYLFTAVSFAQMAEWALKKHKAYKKQFGDKIPKNRKAIIPFLL